MYFLHPVDLTGFSLHKNDTTRSNMVETFRFQPSPSIA